MPTTRSTRAARLLLAVYLLEAGTFLIVSPLSRHWIERVAVRAPRRTQAVLGSPYFRGFVFGLGVLHVAAALLEIERWRRERASR